MKIIDAIGIAAILIMALGFIVLGLKTEYEKFQTTQSILEN